ncbi:hypothetical protein Poly24_51040 [Rosistilla carotiformis]|uniref:Secreted protein n=1 Tax=Rosistilla carotiformis TaxID=2528017 RepID=A0A518K0P8_9BACT|nr:hypothetical protein Poly24_51040 [Rosistilla carotiformis]
MLMKYVACGFLIISCLVCGCGGGGLGEATDEQAQQSMDATLNMESPARLDP